MATGCGQRVGSAIGVGAIGAEARFSTSSKYTARQGARPGSEEPRPARQIGPRKRSASTHCKPACSASDRQRSGRNATGPRRAQWKRYGLNGLSVNSHSRPPGISSRSHSARNSAAPPTTACCTTIACRLSVGNGNGIAQRASPAKRPAVRNRRNPRPSSNSRGGNTLVGATHNQGWDGRVCSASSARRRSDWSRLRPAPVSNQDETA